MPDVEESENIDEDEELNDQALGAAASSRQSKVASQVNFVRSGNLTTTAYGMATGKAGDPESQYTSEKDTK